MKSGIDYFPLDVDLNEKFELIEAEFGLTGFGVVVKLLQRIYKGRGYYIEWTYEVALLFAKRVGLGGGVVSEIIEASVKWGMFDQDLYDKYRILTSRGIQKRYFEAVSRRKEIEIDARILLVNVDNLLKNVNIKQKNVYINAENDDIPKQSKVEKSKVKKSRERGADAPTPAPFSIPSMEELKAYCQKDKLSIDVQRFFDYYQSRGWIVGNGTPMADWKAAARSWQSREKEFVKDKPFEKPNNRAQEFAQRPLSEQEDLTHLIKY